MKIFLAFLFYLLIAGGVFGQTPFSVSPMSSAGGDSILRPAAGAEHWGTTAFDGVNAPLIPPGNITAANWYERFNWQDIESSTTQGSYNWSTFDAFFDSAIDHNAMFSFGIMIFCNGCGSLGNLPTYVVNAMNTEGKSTWSNGGFTMPNYQSATLVINYCKLLHAIANHIDTAKRSGTLFSKAFLGFDIRDYGNFGEGNGFETGTNTASQCPAGAQITDTYLIRMTDSAIAIFPNVQLTIPMAYVAPNNDYSNADGQTGTQAAYHQLTASNSYGRIGWRRDNIGDNGYNPYLTGTTASYNPGSGNIPLKPLIMNAGQVAPIGGEPANDLGGISRGGYPMWDAYNEDTLFKMTYFGNGNYPLLMTNQSSQTVTCNLPPCGSPTVTFTHGGDSIRTNMVRMSAFAGPRIVVDGGSIANLVSGAPFVILTQWKNKGLAPVYEKWNIVFELRQTDGVTVVARDTSLFALRLFQPRTTDSSWLDVFSLPTLTAGSYKLYIIIRDPIGYKKPYPIANYGRLSDGSYLLANVTVSASTPTTSFVIGSGVPGSSVSLTSMTGHNFGDTAKVATLTSGSYTSLTLKDIQGIYVMNQDPSRPATFSTQGTWCRAVSVKLIGRFNFISAGNSTAIDCSCGRLDSCLVDSSYFQGWSSTVFGVAGNITYTPGFDSTYHWMNDTVRNCTTYLCNRLVQGSFGVQPISNTDVARGVHIYQNKFIATTSTSFEPIQYTGVCYNCYFDHNVITSTTQRPASGDCGVVAGSGLWHVHDNYMNGGPGYMMRMFPMKEPRDGADSITFYNNGKFNGTEYGMVNLQYYSSDTLAGQRIACGAGLWNNTMGNQFNDTLGYYSPMFNMGALAPGRHYWIKNNFAFNVGNNPQRQAAGGQPNNGVPQLAYNLGGDASLGTDTSNNNYSKYASITLLDSTTTLITNTLGNFPGFYLSANSPNLLHAGVTNPLTTKDYSGMTMRVPPDLGYLQFNSAIFAPKTYIPGLRKGVPKRFLLR